jgi:hypothetical protein
MRVEHRPIGHTGQPARHEGRDEHAKVEEFGNVVDVATLASQQDRSSCSAVRSGLRRTHIMTALRFDDPIIRHPASTHTLTVDTFTVVRRGVTGR